jgi:hypothetical protein
MPSLKAEADACDNTAKTRLIVMTNLNIKKASSSTHLIYNRHTLPCINKQSAFSKKFNSAGFSKL